MLVGALVVHPAVARAACDATIYGTDSGGGLWQFTPPSAVAVRAPTSPTLVYGTDLRGPVTGNVYQVSIGPPSSIYSYNLTTHVNSGALAALGNAGQILAGGFGSDGIGYLLGSSESYEFTDAAVPVVTKEGTPVTSSGPAYGTLNGGDLAVDASNLGWTIATYGANSYLYTVAFGPVQTNLNLVAQLTVGGLPYAGGDLYSLAFGADQKLYASAYSSGNLYSITPTGVMTLIGAQGVALADFASCPFSSLTFSKNGPSQTAAGELMSYGVVVKNAATSSSAAGGLALSDPVPAGITITGATCTTPVGSACTAPVVAGNLVTATVTSLAPGAAATLTISGKNTGLALGTVTNVAKVTSSGQPITASVSTSVVANDVTKTVANITKGTGPGTALTGVPGDTVEFVLSYTNHTNAPLQAFALNDTVPANLTYVAASASCVTPAAPACTAPAAPTGLGVLTWTFSGAIAVNATVSVKFRATIK